MPEKKVSRPPPKRPYRRSTYPTRKIWAKDNWFSLMTMFAQVALGLIFLGKMSGTIETLQSDVSEIKSRMVEKATMDLKFEQIQTSIKNIEDNQTKQDMRVSNIEQRFMNGPSK